MNNLSQYILEKLHLKKDNKLCDYHPKDRTELRKLIEQLLEERGENANMNDIDVSKVTDMSWLFYKLDPHNIDISQWDVSNVRTMFHMFHDCKNLNCNISSWDVSSVSNMQMMFINCKSFDTKQLDKWEPKSLIHNDTYDSTFNMFSGCGKKHKPIWYVEC